MLRLALLLLFALPSTVRAQESRTDSTFAELRADGNGVAALRTIIRGGFNGQRASDALKTVADQAQLNITFNPKLPELRTMLTIVAHERSAASALLEVARESRLRVRVSREGQLVVAALPVISPQPVVESVPDTNRITTLAAMHSEGSRIERQMFDEKPNVGRLVVGSKELSTAPRFFAEADLLRTVQLLPGVEARNDFNAGMNVRGGESDQNLVLLDGYPIYSPFHLGGLFGTFIGPTVGSVDLFTGGFPAPYGNRLSSVLDVRSAEELRNGLHGTANVSLIASTASLGSAIRKGRGSWMVAARRTYIDKAVKVFSKEELPYDFRDAQGHVAYGFANGIRLSATGYAGHDALSTVIAEGGKWFFSWGNRVVGATAARSFGRAPGFLLLGRGDSAVVEQRASFSAFNADISLDNAALLIHTPVRDARLGGFVAGFGGHHTRTLGYELASQRFRYESNVSLPILPGDSAVQRMYSGSVYFDDLWRPSPKLLIDAGARLDAVTGHGWWHVSPRLSAKYFLNDNLAITAATGEYAQWVRSVAREDVPVRPLDLWVGSAKDWPVSMARHYVLGAEGWLNRNRGFRVETFLKTYRDLLETNATDDAQKLGDEFLFLRGSSWGADVMLRQFQVNKFSGWMAYTFAMNKRIGLDGKAFHPGQDRRHDLNLVGSWQYTKYVLGARYNLATGTPYSYPVGSFDRVRYDPLTREYGQHDDATQYLVLERNGARLPPTQRLDLSVTRNGHIGGKAFSPYLSVVNAMNSKNVFIYVFDYQERPPKRTSIHQLSIVPTFGFSLAW